jgi:hypothetical protein
MKRTPEARNVMRGLIHHAMEHADMHARAMEDGHIADEHRAMHHAMAMRSLDQASDMHDVYRSVFLGDKANQDIVVDGGEMGVVYGTPGIAEGELKLRFSQVAAKVGKLPVSLRSLVKSELGTDNAEMVEEKLMNLKGIQERFVALKTEHERGVVAAEKIAADKLISDAENDRLISPAEAKRMRGIDPATGAVLSQGAYTKTRIERFLDERRQSGPIADIARPGAERTVSAPQQDMTAGSKPASLIRWGTAPQQANPAAISNLAAEIARNVKGVDSAKILSYVDEAAQLPNSDGHAAIQRGNSLK